MRLGERIRGVLCQGQPQRARCLPGPSCPGQVFFPFLRIGDQSTTVPAADSSVLQAAEQGGEFSVHHLAVDQAPSLNGRQWEAQLLQDSVASCSTWI